jgi:hypothetical protein
MLGLLAPAGSERDGRKIGARSIVPLRPGDLDERYDTGMHGCRRVKSLKEPVGPRRASLYTHIHFDKAYCLCLLLNYEPLCLNDRHGRKKDGETLECWWSEASVMTDIGVQGRREPLELQSNNNPIPLS